MLKIFLVSVDIGFLGNSKKIKVINFLLFRSTSGHHCDFSEKQTGHGGVTQAYGPEFHSQGPHKELGTSKENMAVIPGLFK